MSFLHRFWKPHAVRGQNKWVRHSPQVLYNTMWKCKPSEKKKKRKKRWEKSETEQEMSSTKLI